MWWLRKKRPRAGREAQKVNGLKESMITSLRSGSLKGKILQMEVVEDFESRPHKSSVFCGVKRKGHKGMERAGSCRGCCLVTVEGGCQKGEEVNEDGEKEESGVKSLKKWLQASRRRSACMMVSRKAAQRPAKRSFMRSWDCSHIENEEEEEGWREGDQMAAQWE